MKDKTLALLILKRLCECRDPSREGSVPTNWGPGHVEIPHHCDCPMYPVELPDPVAAPAAYNDALRMREELST